MKSLNVVVAVFFSILVAQGQSGSIYMRTHENLSLGWSTSAYESWEYRRDNANGTADYLPFRMLKPVGYNQNSSVKYPLILMLHGRGEAGWGNEKQLKNGGKKHLDAVTSNKFKGFVVFPQEPWGAWSFGNPEDTLSANQLSAAITQAWELVDSLVLKYNVDPDRIVVHGLSSGGTGTLVSLYHRPDLFAGASPMSATTTIGSWESGTTTTRVRNNMGIVAPIPVWWFQGEIDDNPPTSVTDPSIGFLRDSGAINLAQTKYTIYANTGHGVWNKAYAESDFFPYFLRQNKRNIYVMGNNPICCGKGTDLAFSKGFYQYQWFKDGVAIPGAVTHKLRNITSSGVYSVRYVKRGSSVPVFSNTVTLTGGNISPVVSLGSPGNNSSFVAPASINLTANASDADGTVSKVDFYQGTTLLFSDVSAPYSYAWNNVSSGNYALKAVATDNFGTATTSAIVNVNVTNALNQAPVVSLTSPSNGTSFTAPASVNLAATASDPDGTVSKVDFYNGVNLLYSDVSAPFSYVWSGVPVGNYAVTAVATDNLGTSKTSSVINIVVNPVPNQLPVVSISTPNNGANFTAPASINLSANASDPDGEISKVEFFNGAILIASDSTSPYSFNWVNVSAGNYNITAVATDNNGGTKTSSVIAVSVASSGLNGLTAEYFNNMTLSGSPYLVRVDPFVDNLWSGSPAAGIVANVFSVRWTGMVQPAYNELYTFYTKSDDGVRLYVNDVLIVNNWTNHGSTENSGTIALSANQKYNIRLEFFDNCCAAEIRLLWSSGSQSKQVIPQSNLFPNTTPQNQLPTVSLTSPVSGSSFTAPANINLSANASDADGSIAKVDFYNGAILIGSEASAPYTFAWNNVPSGNYSLTAVATDNQGGTSTSSVVSVNVASLGGPNGTGLTAEYFNNMTLSGSPYLVRVDPFVDNLWSGSPAAGIVANVFSVRWTGMVQPAYNELYTFYTKSDDGVRLYVNDVLIVNNWTNHGSTENSGTIALSANQKYNIRLEFFDNCCTAEIRLLWSSASQSKQVIPQSNLFPNANLRSENEVAAIGDYVNTSATVFPQPVFNTMNVSYNSISTGNTEISLMDNLGNIKESYAVEVQKGNNILTFDVNDLKPGIYIMLIKSNDKTENLKIVKE